MKEIILIMLLMATSTITKAQSKAIPDSLLLYDFIDVGAKSKPMVYPHRYPPTSLSTVNTKDAVNTIVIVDDKIYRVGEKYTFIRTDFTLVKEIHDTLSTSGIKHIFIYATKKKGAK